MQRFYAKQMFIVWKTDKNPFFLDFHLTQCTEHKPA